MSENGNLKHGPHGPGCKCDSEPELSPEEAELLAAGIAITKVLANVLPLLLDAWTDGRPGVTVDFKFNHRAEVVH